MWMNDKVFKQLVQERFSFLQKKYHMHVINAGIEECVRFQSNITWIEVWFDKYSLDIRMGTNRGHYRASLWDIMQFVTVEGSSSSYMASDEVNLNKGLKRLSGYVELYCDEALSGNIEFYKEVQSNKKTHEQKAAIENEIRDIEVRAKAAWEKKDYAKIIGLYNSISEYLSPTQKKMLEISKKRIND